MAKQLTQDIFKDAPDWVRSAAVDSDGRAWGYAETTAYLSTSSFYHFFSLDGGGTVDTRTRLLGYGYATDDWRTSAIDREELRPTFNEPLLYPAYFREWDSTTKSIEYSIYFRDFAGVVVRGTSFVDTCRTAIRTLAEVAAAMDKLPKPSAPRDGDIMLELKLKEK